MNEDDFTDEDSEDLDEDESGPAPYGITDPEEMKALRDRFARGYRKNGAHGCWLWTKHRDRDGYGQIKIKGIARRAHRVSYLLNIGPIRDGYDVDHVCRIRNCVNPASNHIEEVTHTENMRRMRASVVHMVPDENTTPEEVLSWAQEILDRSNNTWYPTERNDRWPVALATQASWRDVNFDEGFLPEGDKWAVAALYLEVISLGVNPNAAAKQLFRISPLSVKRWVKNPLWTEDLTIARETGRKTRLGELEERVVDALERKMNKAEYKDLVGLAKVLGERGDRKFKPETAPAVTGPTLQFLGTPEQQAATALALVTALNAPIDVDYKVIDDND